MNTPNNSIRHHFARGSRPVARSLLARLAWVAGIGAAVVHPLAARPALAQPSPKSPSPSLPPSPSPSACEAWDVDYALAANLQLTDTPLGQGDGVYPIGPGTLVLRYDDVGGRPGGHVKMISYEVRQSFQVVAKTLFGATTVGTDVTTREKADPCGAPAEGRLDAAAIVWPTPVVGFRTDGFLTCGGTFCGKFGAPPPGRSAMASGPEPVHFKPFLFSDDHATFTMAYTFVSKTESPKQTAHLSLAGRETARVCVQTKVCVPGGPGHQDGHPEGAGR
jgi:hypothetical protein